MERKRSVRRYGSRRYKKSFGAKCKDFWRNFIAFMFSNVGIIGLVVGYTIAGAFMFRAIEGKPDDDIEDGGPTLETARNETTALLWALLEEGVVPAAEGSEDTWCLHADPVLRVYTEQVVVAIGEGFDGVNDVVDLRKKWSFSGAFLYSLTVITTIGYGNVSPKKPLGKIMTIVYAIAGMPLFLLYLSNIGDILARCFKWLYAKCCLCRWCPTVARRREERRRRRMQGDDEPHLDDTQRRHTSVSMPEDEFDLRQLPHEDVDEEEDASDDGTQGTYDDEYDSQTVTVPVTICLTIMVGYVFGGAMLFAYYEDWELLDGSYFCFISLSTIGFGDIVPGESIYYTEDPALTISFIFCSMYLMLGMALIAMCFNLMQEEVINKIRKVVRTVRRICR